MGGDDICMKKIILDSGLQVLFSSKAVPFVNGRSLMSTKLYEGTPGEENILFSFAALPLINGRSLVSVKIYADFSRGRKHG